MVTLRFSRSQVFLLFSVWWVTPLSADSVFPFTVNFMWVDAALAVEPRPDITIVTPYGDGDGRPVLLSATADDATHADLSEVRSFCFRKPLRHHVREGGILP